MLVARRRTESGIRFITGMPLLAGALAAPDEMQTDQPGSVQRAVGQHGRARTTRPQKSMDSVFERSRGGFRPQIRLLAAQGGRPLCLRVTGGNLYGGTAILADRRPSL